MQLENPNLSLSLTEKIRDGRLYVDHGVIAGAQAALRTISLLQHRYLKQTAPE